MIELKGGADPHDSQYRVLFSVERMANKFFLILSQINWQGLTIEK